MPSWCERCGFSITHTRHGREQWLCKRYGCPHRHLTSPRSHGYCCNACREQSQGKWWLPTVHTKSCSGRPVSADASSYEPDGSGWGITGREIPCTGRPASAYAFEIPHYWQCATSIPVEDIEWYMTRFGLDLPWGSFFAWVDLGNARQHRPLTIYAVAVDDGFPVPVHNFNVDLRELTAQSELYDYQSVTGIDFIVQAVLLSQSDTTQVLKDAYDTIEGLIPGFKGHKLTKFGFACHDGTHKSVGCALLLGLLLYPNADIVFSTWRTCQAADRQGMARRNESC